MDDEQDRGNPAITIMVLVIVALAAAGLFFGLHLMTASYP